MSKVFAVVLAGGSGTRFWPASRTKMPKQLLSLAPGEGILLRQTVDRLLPLTASERVFISTGQRVLDVTRAALPELPREQFLAEPMAKNTAPCIAWATDHIARLDSNAIVIVVPSDQYIADVAGYHGALQMAIASAEAGHITTLGIAPTRPETGYGYIEAAEKRPGHAVAVNRFVEKPNLETAKAYLASGNYYWNAGMFVFKASVMRAAIAEHAPALSAELKRLDGRSDEASVRSFFEAVDSDSIDYAIMEKTTDLHVVPADIGWSDLGSFQVAWELAEKSEQGNALPVGAIAVDATGNLVMDLRTKRPRDSAVALVGVSDLCVVQTDDALLVVPRERCQDVRTVVQQLKDAGRDELV